MVKFYFSFFDTKNIGAINTNKTNEKNSCTSGYENLTRYTNEKNKQQFRFNRVRSVPSTTPSHGKLPVLKK